MGKWVFTTACTWAFSFSTCPWSSRSTLTSLRSFSSESLASDRRKPVMVRMRRMRKLHAWADHSIISVWSRNFIITLSTFSRVFADVSTYGTPPHCCARDWHSDNGTLRLSFKSHLLPTRRNGIFSSFFTRKICSLRNMEWIIFSELISSDAFHTP